MFKNIISIHPKNTKDFELIRSDGRLLLLRPVRRWRWPLLDPDLLYTTRLARVCASVRRIPWMVYVLKSMKSRHIFYMNYNGKGVLEAPPCCGWLWQQRGVYFEEFSWLRAVTGVAKKNSLTQFSKLMSMKTQHVSHRNCNQMINTLRPLSAPGVWFSDLSCIW